MATTKKHLSGKLTISRTTSNYDNPRPITISLIDELSGQQFVEVHLSLADFAEALTGLSHVPCQFECRGKGRVGKRRETKTEAVFVPVKSWADDARRAAAIGKAIGTFEIDGWQGNDRDARNHHRSCRHNQPGPDGEKDGGWYMVGFERWVDVGEGGEGTTGEKTS